MNSAKVAKQRLLSVLDIDRSKLGYRRVGPFLLRMPFFKVAVDKGEVLVIESRQHYRIERHA